MGRCPGADGVQRKDQETKAKCEAILPVDSGTTYASTTWDDLRKRVQEFKDHDQEHKAACKVLYQAIAQFKKDVDTCLEDARKYSEAVEKMIEKKRKRRAELNAGIDALNRDILRLETNCALILTHLVADEVERSGHLGDVRTPSPRPRQSRQGRGASRKLDRSSHDLQ